MKDELRYKYKIKRKYFQHSAREVAEGAIYDAALTLLSPCESVFIYNSFGSEVDTKKLIATLISLGKRVYLPKISNGEMFAVRYKEGTTLTKNRYGIGEPEGEPYAVEFDAVVIPLLAFNRRGYRLGYGGGFYDKFLRTSNAEKIGLAFSLQLSNEFNEDGWDVPLDLVITEKGIYSFNV